MMFHLQCRLMIIGFICCISACSSGNKQTAATSVTETKHTQSINPNEASIQHVDIQVLESFPVQVQVAVQGQLTDSCSQLDDFLEEREGNTFIIKILLARSSQKGCRQTSKTFNRIIPLDVENLQAGAYTVNVNGVTETFELTLDNSL
ncbi:MAG: hypothetical protein SVR94_04525 [Pseudomonadota bacterium]|nr:hypothetical protein [Pseudomonadota bacterium]